MENNIELRKMDLESFLIEYAENGWKIIVCKTGHGNQGEDNNFECDIFDKDGNYIISYDENDGFLKLTNQ